MKDIFKTIISEFHEWKLPEMIDRKIDVNPTLPLITTIIGSRRSGKTYLLFQLIKHLENTRVSREQIVYINFEDERLNLEAKDLDLILQSYVELFPETDLNQVYFFFDEIQNITGWERFVRRIFDHYSKKIFVTGSNSKLLSVEIADALRGRTITHTVYPLNFEEYLQFRKCSFNPHTLKQKTKILNASLDFIKQGSFPELVNFDNKSRHSVLQSYFNSMIYRDIIDRYKITDPGILKFFIKKMFANIGKPLSINKIYRDLQSMNYKVSNNYLYLYEAYCYNVFLGIEVKKFDFSEIKQLKADKKMYCIDSGLLGSIEFSISENKGKLLENAVLCELVKRGYEVFYYQGRNECDFLAKKDNQWLPIQVAWQIDVTETKSREVRGCKEVCEQLGLSNAQIVTFDTKEHISNGIDIEVFPFYEWSMAL